MRVRARGGQEQGAGRRGHRLAGRTPRPDRGSRARLGHHGRAVLPRRHRGTRGGSLRARRGAEADDPAPRRPRQERDHGTPAGGRRRLWRPVPADCALPTGAEKARWLIGYIESTWPALGHPCTERAVGYALACAARRAEAHDDERAVLVHGDVHQWNVLEAPQGGFKLIDPDGLRAEAEYDLGILVREDPVELRDGDPWARPAGWPGAAASTPPRSGSGARSSGCPPACWPP
jgi:aminoglycoside/hydroxyurea antibiotic resistance kinase